jgi:UDP-3-O-[3-hydroxymyristoyl] glucosamine N-acyltransferase
VPALKEIADLVGGEVIGDDQVLITGIHSLLEASPGELSFFGDPRYKESLKETKASALLVPAFTDRRPGSRAKAKRPLSTRAPGLGRMSLSILSFMWEKRQ